MNFEFRQLRKMAKAYKQQNPDVTIHRAVHEANKAYELFREAEAEVNLDMIFSSQ